MKQKIISLLLILMPSLAVMAQEEFADDVQDLAPAAPIDNYILIAIVIAIYIAYQFLNKQQVNHKL
jgi:amino acid permease